MWLTRLVVAAAETTPPANPPEIPYDQIGLVLVAVVGALSAVIVAVIQRGSKTSSSSPAPQATPPPPGGFTLSEKEWITVRDGLTRVEAHVEYMRETYKDHDESSTTLHTIFHKDLDHIKRELGIK